jgi:hypothetical protein
MTILTSVAKVLRPNANATTSQLKVAASPPESKQADANVLTAHEPASENGLVIAQLNGGAGLW